MKTNKLFTEVNGFSQIVALLLFIGVFFLGFYLGIRWDQQDALDRPSVLAPSLVAGLASTTPIISSVVFTCSEKSAGKLIHAAFQKSSVALRLSDGRSIALPQVTSGSGARYANADESIVFWNKGKSAFITEGPATTYKDCVTQ